MEQMRSWITHVRAEYLSLSRQPVFLASGSGVFEGELRAAVSKSVDGNEDNPLILSLKLILRVSRSAFTEFV